MSNNKYVIGILGLLFLTSISSAYTVLGGAFYCGNSSMTGDQICTDCTNALNNNTYNFTFLNATVSGATATCIDDPNLIDFKTFNCDGHTIRGTHTGSTLGIDIEGEIDVTIIGCEVSGFTEGYYITDNSDNITVINGTAYNNTDAGFRILSSDNVTVIDSLSYNNSNYGFWVQSSDDFEADNTTAYDNNMGYYVRTSDYGDYFECNASDNNNYGFWFRESARNGIYDSIAHNTGMGFYISDDTSDFNTIDNLTSTSNSAEGIQIRNADNNSILNSLVDNNNGNGIEFYLNADDNIIDLTTVSSNGLGGGNPGNGIYIHETCLRNNITQTNVSTSGIDGIRIYQSCDDTFIYNVRSFYNNLSGINISEESDNTEIYNSPFWENNLHGIYIYNSDATLIVSHDVLHSPFTVIYENNGTGIYLEQAGNTNIIGVLRNLTVHSNKGNGVMFDQTPNSNLTQVVVRNNSVNGVYLSGNSDFNLIELSYIYNNAQHCIAVSTGADLNDLVSNYVYGCGWSGFGIDGTNNVFDDNDVFNNAFHGFHIATNGNNNFTNNEVYNNTQYGIYVQDVDNNIFVNNTLYGNGPGGTVYDILLTGLANDNLFSHTAIYTNKTGFETSRYILQQPTASPTNNFTNLTICYNESIGCSAWDFLNLSDAALRTTTFIAHPYFISLNSAGAPEFNKSANITIAVDQCEPVLKVIRKTGFPTTLADVLTGDPYSTIYTCSDNVLRFPVTAFSGYAANVSLTECFYANSPDTVYNVAANLAGNKSDGICITLNASNIMINCSGYSVTGNFSGTTYGIATGRADLENITLQGCSISNYSRGITLDSSINTTVFNNTLFDNTYGIETLSIWYGLIDNNIIYNNSRGARIGANWTNITNNIVYNNSISGIETNPTGISSNFGLIANNLAHDNGIGFGIYIFHNGTVYNNTAYNNTNGMHVLQSSDNLFNLNRLYNNSVYGLVAVMSSYNTIVNNTIYDNYDGIFAFMSDVTNYTNNTVSGNTYYGFHLSNSTQNNLLFMNFYDNGYDLFLNATDATSALDIGVVNATFRNPMGTLVNYTMLSLSDSVAISTAYSINWTTNSTSLPPNFISFAQKFVNITAQAGAVSIDSITWHWTDAELLPIYNESLFVLSKYNTSGWFHLNNTPDTGANTLSLTNMNPASDYGILQNNTPPNYCVVINAPGAYQLGGNAVGAPNAFGNMWGLSTTCILIESDNVTFNCNGYNITNDGTANAAGIAINGTNPFPVPNPYANITIMNCPGITGYADGVYAQSIVNSTIRNVTSYVNSIDFMLVNSQANNITNNTAYGTGSGNGFYLTGLGGNNLVDNKVYRKALGFRTLSCNNNNFTDNWAYNNSIGFYVGGDNNRYWDNIAETNLQYGFQLRNANNNWLINNTAWGNWNHGFFVDGSNNPVTNNRLINNTAHSNWDHGFFLYRNGGLGVDSTYLINNTAYSNWDNGFYLNEVTNTNITNITSRNNDYGVLMVDSPNTYVGDSTIYTNGFSGIRVDGDSDDAVIYNNNVTDNSPDGIQVYDSVNSNITENTVYDNAQHGINIFDAWYHTVHDNTIYDNGGRGIDFANVTYSNVSDNRIYNNLDHGIHLRTYNSGPSIYNTFINNTVFNHTTSAIRIITNSDSNVFINNTIYNIGTFGFSISSSANSNLTGNDVSNTGDPAYYFYDSDNNRLLHNRGYNTSGSNSGMYFFHNSSNNYLLNNTANLADLNGFLFTNATYNTVINNTAMFSGGCGFNTFWNSHRNYFDNNTAYNHTASGFCGERANHSLFINNTVYNSGYDSTSYGAGFAFNNFSNHTFIDNIAYDNGAPGLFPGYLLGTHFGLAGGDDITVVNNICFNTTGTTPSLFGIGIANSENVLVDDNFIHGSFIGIPAFGNINASDVFGIPAPIMPIDNLDITNNYVELSFMGIWTMNATNTNVQHNEVQRSIGGILLHTTDLDVYNNTINVSDPSGGAPIIIGMAAVNSPDATIHENNITTSFLTMGIGALLVGENNTQFYQNDINASGIGIVAMDNFSMAMFGIPPLPPPFPNLDFQGNSYGLEIYNNRIHDSLMAGAFLINYTGTTADPTNNEFRSNDIYNNGYGLMINNTNNVDFDTAAFTGNTLDNNGYGLGIHMSNDVTVMRSGITITNSATSGVAVNLPMFGLGPSDSITIERIDDATGDYGEYYGNITNLLLVSNASDVNGRVLFPDVNVSVATLLDNTNFLLENDFVSLDSAAATDFNVTANVVLYTDSCAADVYIHPGFPQNRSIIVDNGTIYAPSYFNCAGNTADFGVNSFSGYALNVTIIPPPPGDGRGGGGPTCEDAGLELLEIQCPGNRLLFLVTDEDDNPVEGARVALVRTTGGYWSAVSYSDSDGMVEFTLSTNNEYTVEVSGGRTEDYCSDSMVIDYMLCPEEGCYDDDDCEDMEYCEREDLPMIDMPPELLDLIILPGMCVPVDCECGEVYDHECHEYDCCADTDCPEGYVCENHECVPRECESDSDCGETEQCVDGECILIEIGDCGYIENHTWYDYECCKDEDCPPGEICYENECILYRIETNETGFVGDQHSFRVYPEGQYDITITDPDGRTFDVTTGGEGYGEFLLESEGKYGIELIEEEVPVIMVDVDSLKRPLQPPEERPITILDEFLKYFWWLLILLLLIIGYILFRRRKKKKYKVGE